MRTMLAAVILASLGTVGCAADADVVRHERAPGHDPAHEHGDGGGVHGADGGAGAPAAAQGTGDIGVWHLVWIDLEDEARLDELRADCDRLLAPIPSVIHYTCGTPLDTGRDNVSDDYDLALVLGHTDVDGYRAYLEHPDHVALVTKWKGHIGLTIHDVAAGHIAP